MISAAMIQMRSGTDVRENIEASSDFITQAVKNGAELVFTPEMTSLLDKRPGEVENKAMLEADDMALREYRNLAKSLMVKLHIGSLPILKSNGCLANRSFLIGETGDLLCKYDKIHMFDVDLPDGQVIRESQKYEPGLDAIICPTDIGIIGMSVCYDVRFPHLYTDLALSGAEIIPVPSAFTVPTGQAHWHVLLRARAIENGCYIVGAAQAGNHQDGRETYGHSLAVSPWGEVIAEGDNALGVVPFEMDLSQVQKTRNRIPNLKNRRGYNQPTKP